MALTSGCIIMFLPLVSELPCTKKNDNKIWSQKCIVIVDNWNKKFRGNFDLEAFLDVEPAFSWLVYGSRRTINRRGSDALA